MAFPFGTTEDEAPAPSEIPSGGNMSPGPAMPTPSLASLSPGGGAGMNFVGSLANAFQTAVGGMLHDKQLEQQGIDREQEAGKYRLLLPIGQALAESQRLAAAGDLPGAMAAYQKVAQYGPI